MPPMRQHRTKRRGACLHGSNGLLKWGLGVSARAPEDEEVDVGGAHALQGPLTGLPAREQLQI